MTSKQVLDSWIEERRISLIENYNRLGLRASGSFEQGVRNESTDYSVAMYAPYHTWHMVNGRKPNKDQSKEGLKKFVGWAGSTFLAKWVRDKGININPYAVAYKIARGGVVVPNNHNTGTLLTDTFTPQAYDELYKSILNIYKVELKTTIQQTWQQ